VQVLAPVKAFKQAHPAVQIVLQPAVSDAHHIPVHPQPPFAPAAAAGTLHVPAPAHVAVGPALLSMTTIPVLSDLAAAEVAQQVRALRGGGGCAVLCRGATALCQPRSDCCAILTPWPLSAVHRRSECRSSLRCSCSRRRHLAWLHCRTT
jgi:hypothetical protein